MANENDLSGKVGLDVSDFKSGVADLNREIRVIESGFRAAAAGTEDWSKDSDTLSKRIDSLGQIIEAQKKKVDKTKEAYDQVAAAQGENSKAAQDLAIKLNNETQALNKSEQSLKKNEAALKDMGNETVDAGKNATKRGGSVALKAIADVGIASALAAAGLFKITTNAGEAADELITMSNKTGISTDQLQKMQYAARFVDVEVDTMTGSMQKLIKTMDKARDGNKDASAAYDTLGVSVTNSDGSLRDSQDVWLETINALGGVSNETERNALAMSIFGKSAAELNPLIVAGGDSIAKLGKEAENLGLIMSDKSVVALGAFDDQIQTLQASTGGLRNAIAIAALPAMSAFVGTVQDLATATLGAVQSGDWTAVTETINTAMTGAVEGISGMISTIAPKIVPILGNIVQTIADTAPQLVPVLVDTALMLLNTLITFVVNNSQMLIDTAMTMILALTQGLIDALPQLIPAAVMIIVQLGLGLIAALPQIIAMLPQIYAGIKDGLTALDWGEIGKQIIAGITQGVVNAAKALANAVVEAAKSALKAAKNFLGIKSPSTVFRDQVGSMIGAGMAQGINNSVPTVNAAMNQLNKQLTAEAGINVSASSSALKTGTPGIGMAAGNTVIMPVTLNVKSAAEATRELNILSKQLASQF